QIPPPQPTDADGLNPKASFLLAAMSRVSAKPYFVYILWSQSGRCFYIGISENPVHRLQQHNEGKRGWTARHRPWKLVHQEERPSYREARRRELELKRQKGGRRFYELTGLDRARYHPRSQVRGS
ncbi:MAG: GIY-YIG nuclease family protein, partial [Terriglobales bacterium]